jgi:tmRNA-binding protein
LSSQFALEKWQAESRARCRPGKVARDKRADLKKRAIDRETAREVARFNRKHG